MKVLVSGAGGFLGSTLCEELLRRGNEVRAMTHYGTGNIEHLKGSIEVIRGDVRFPDECREAVKGVEAVAHLAALIHVDRSRHYPRLFWETNVLGTMNVLEACRAEDARMIQMSTCEILGNIPHGKADEEYPFKQPRSPYAASKHVAEAYCHAYHATYGLPVTVLRGFNICGPRQKKGGKGAVIPIFADRVLKGLPPQIYGSGEQTRDYTDARDIARGIAEALCKEGLGGELIHLCSGLERSINIVAREVITACESELKPIHVEVRPGELMRSVGDNTKAGRLLGWKPRIPFERSVRDTVDYMRRRMLGSRR